MIFAVFDVLVAACRRYTVYKVPAYILCLLWNWYGHYCARILWAGIISDDFDICSRVRQCDILSPFLFAV